jgi:hypothetical protein
MDLMLVGTSTDKSNFRIISSSSSSSSIYYYITQPNQCFIITVTFSESLGLTNGKVPDDCITASSALDDNHSPACCRLNSKEEGEKMAGWAAKENDENQWIQVDFGKLAEITRVSTQGKGGESPHHVTSYLLSFSTDGENFTTYQEGGQDKVQ